jgi:iron complex outermembrane receptor protein
MHRFLLTIAVVTAIGMPTASAQFLDYGALEALFGEPVTTSATGLPQRASEVPVNMEIVTAEDIRRSGATSIPEVLRQIVGVDVRQFGIDTFEVGIRGYNQPINPRLLVMVNGRQVYLDDYGRTNWSAIPVQITEIRQLEIVKGPAGALFGVNAASGVVNIITYSPLTDDVDVVQGTLGTQGLGQGSVVGTARLGPRTGLRLSAGARRSDEFSRGLADFTRPYLSDPISRSFLADLQSEVAPGLRVGAEISGSKVGRSEFLHFASIMDSDYGTFSAKGSVTADTRVGLVEAVAYHNVADIRITSPGLSDFETQNRVSVLKLSDTFKLGDHAVRLGAEYRHNEFDDPSGLEAEVGYDIYSASGVWAWPLTDRLTFTNAARLDHLRLERSGTVLPASPSPNEAYGESLTEWSLNSGFVWQASERDTLRLTFGRAIQLPSLAEYGYADPPSADIPIYSFGNPRLAPTKVTQAEVSYDRKVEAIGGSVRAGIFGLRYRDLKAIYGPYGFVDGAPVTIYRSVGRSSSIGAEISARGSSGPWRWQAGYGVQAVNDHLFPGVLGLEFEDSTPVQTLRGSVGWKDGPWEADLFAYAQSRTSQQEDLGGGETQTRAIPAYLTLSGRVAYNVTDEAEIAVIGRQLDSGSRRVSIGGEVERQALVTLTWRPQ